MLLYLLIILVVIVIINVFLERMNFFSKFFDEDRRILILASVFLMSIYFPYVMFCISFPMSLFICLFSSLLIGFVVEKLQSAFASRGGVIKVLKEKGIIREEKVKKPKAAGVNEQVEEQETAKEIVIEDKALEESVEDKPVEDKAVEDKLVGEKVDLIIEEVADLVMESKTEEIAVDFKEQPGIEANFEERSDEITDIVEAMVEEIQEDVIVGKKDEDVEEKPSENVEEALEEMLMEEAKVPFLEAQEDVLVEEAEAIQDAKNIEVIEENEEVVEAVEAIEEAVDEIAPEEYEISAETLSSNQILMSHDEYSTEEIDQISHHDYEETVALLKENQNEKELSDLKLESEMETEMKTLIEADLEVKSLLNEEYEIDHKVAISDEEANNILVEISTLRENGDFDIASNLCDDLIKRDIDTEIAIKAILEMCLIYKAVGKDEIARHILSAYVAEYRDIIDEDTKLKIAYNFDLEVLE